MITRIIPSSGEILPVIGLGTWQTFNVSDKSTYPALETVLQTLHRGGGSLIDSSPMYGMAEQVIGDITSGMDTRNDFFYATKVWTTGKQEGIRQMEASMEKMQRKTMDLMQIHNLTDWQTHWQQLQQWKASGKIRYTGITHYQDSSHEALEKVLRTEKIDFVQFNYSISARNAENRLLDVAADLGVATLINRPFGEGRLFAKVQGKPLPTWAVECGMSNWSAFFLKYIIAHEAVTCVIPATRNPAHAADLITGGTGSLPDQALRKKMAVYMDGL
jgi:diketogulonate reductase-like aldo/keto reductase